MAAMMAVAGRQVGRQRADYPLEFRGMWPQLQFALESRDAPSLHLESGAKSRHFDLLLVKAGCQVLECRCWRFHCTHHSA
jgi:hypothetical protein